MSRITLGGINAGVRGIGRWTTNLVPSELLYRAEHPYPMAPSGGLFLALVGIGLIAAVFFGGDQLADLRVFFVGVGLGLVALMFAGKLSLGKPTRVQIGALVAAIMLEVILFNVQGRMLPSGTNESLRWMWSSMIVGMHFLPMAISFGPRVLVLGAICIALDCRSESPWLAWSGLSPHGRVGEAGDWLMVVV